MNIEYNLNDDLPTNCDEIGSEIKQENTEKEFQRNDKEQNEINKVAKSRELFAKKIVKRKSSPDRMGDEACTPSDKIKKRRYPDKEEFESSKDDMVTDKNYTILLSDLPGVWNYAQIKGYVVNECGVNVMKMMDSSTNKSDYQVELKFSSEEQYKNTLEKLRNKENEGKLKVEIGDCEDEDNNSSSDETVQIHKRETSDIDIWEPDVDGLYGLKLEYLMSLEITPPLVRWINVANFRCDKSELKDVFEMAGRVVFCTVIGTPVKYAKIMYSHPLEAVQAVSMLNGQMFYGYNLKVSMDPFAEINLLLPKGLQNVGPGLGKLGKPVRDLVREFERFVKQKASTIDPSLFSRDYQHRSTGDSVPDSIQSGQFEPKSNSIEAQQTKNKNGSESLNGIDQNLAVSVTNIPLADEVKPSPSGYSSKPSTSNALPNPNDLRQRNNSMSIPARPQVQNPMITNYRPSFPNFQSSPQVQNFYAQPVPINQNMQGNFQPNYQPQPRPNFALQQNPNFQGRPSFQGPPQMPNMVVNPSAMQNPRFQAPEAVPVISSALNNQRALLQNINAPFNSGQNFSPTVPNMTVVPRGPNQQFQGPPRINVQMLRCVDPACLQIINLPLNSTFANICGKLSELGQVVSLDFTTPGCALVKFGTPADAERCFHNYRKVL